MNQNKVNKADIYNEINKDLFRKKLARFTWQAFNTIPEIKNPLILDIGCGTGVPAVELAVLSKGKITAVDIDSKALKKLKIKIKVLRLSSHIKTVKCSLDKLKFKNKYFDIIWSEGSIFFIGFENGLKEWRKFIKPGGYLAVHDEIKDHEKKLKAIPDLKYSLLNHFIISENTWLNDYFRPLEKHINTLKEKYKNNKEVIEIINEESIEIEQYRKSAKDFASVFYIMKKE